MITLTNLTLGYDRHPAVHHVDAVIPSGSLTALVGPNGAGKSTLFKGLAGQIPTMGGNIEHDYQNLGYLPQQAEVDRTFPMSVEQLASTGLWHKTGTFRAISKQHRIIVQDALDRVGISDLKHKPIHALSGGQFQRALFARLLLQQADLLLLDEPFTGVDEQTQHDLLHVLNGLNADGVTIIAVMHDIDLVKKHFPHCLLLSKHLIATGNTEEVLTADNLMRARNLQYLHSHTNDLCETP